MSLSYISQYLLNKLVASPPSIWSGLQIPRDLTPKILLDPSILGEDKNKQMFIIPAVFYPSMEESNRRGPKITSIVTQYVITVGIMVPFEFSPDIQFDHPSDSTHDSAGSLSEELAVLNLWEEFTNYIIQNIPEEYSLVSVEPEPPVEIELGFRNFNVTTDFTFQKVLC